MYLSDISYNANQLDISIDKYLRGVVTEIVHTLPNLKKFAEDHTVEECHAWTGELWSDYELSDEAEAVLDEFAKVLAGKKNGLNLDMDIKIEIVNR